MVVFFFSYIFPGVGLGSLAVGGKTLTDEDFYVAADTLASLVTPDRLAKGCCYPPLDQIRPASSKIAAAVARNIVRTGRASVIPRGTETVDGMMKHCESLMYSPTYDEAK